MSFWERFRGAYRALRDQGRQTEAAKRTREDILAVVHDLRSPLSAILLGAEYLNRTGDSKVRTTARSVERSARRMGRLIDDLLDTVKIESAQLKVEPGRHDVAAIARVLANLLGNAVKLSPEAAVVEIELRASGDEVAIAVRGPGIAGQELFIAQSIVEAHRGRIDVQGATFTVFLPRTP